MGNATIAFCESARNLGVIFDQAFNMEAHVQSVGRSAYFQLRTISNIRHMLPQTVAEQLTHVFITSRVDSCNSLLFGLPDVLIKTLQMIQNVAARMVTRTRNYDHVSPVVRQLHWLPTQEARCC